MRQRESSQSRLALSGSSHTSETTVTPSPTSTSCRLKRIHFPAHADSRPLESDELTILTSWAEAIAEVLSDAPEPAQAVLADPLPGAPWRGALGIEEPSQPLSSAIDSMQEPVGEPSLQRINRR
jgi:hypothetical protein